MPSQMIELPLSDTTASAYLAESKDGSPGVLVLHAWWGLIPFFKRLCDRLAEAGFTALAPDLYFGKTAGTIPEAEALMKQSDEPRMREAAIAAAKALRERTGKPLGAIGFSMGGGWAIALATELAPDDMRACVLFYGVGEGDFSRGHASFIGHFDPKDEYEEDKWVRYTEDKLREAGRPVTFYRYDDAGHWFFEDDKPYYKAEAAQLAWDRTLAFLKSELK